MGKMAQEGVNFVNFRLKKRVFKYDVIYGGRIPASVRPSLTIINFNDFLLNRVLSRGFIFYKTGNPLARGGKKVRPFADL